MTATPNLPGTELLGMPVAIPKIEQTLNQLFHDGTDGKESGMTRASLLNLALYSERPEHLTQNAKTMAEITTVAACRTLLVCVDPNQEATSAHAWLQAHCSIDEVCSEQISFFLNGNSPGMLRNTVFSHLDSDLPLVFWWRGEFSDAFEERLYSRIDRFIFDSETWGNARNQFVRLSEACQSGRANFCIHDLSYTRLNLHRHAISSAFDLPTLRSAIHSIEGMTIRYPAHARMSAVYLAAWVANRLDGVLDRSASSAGKYIFRSNTPGCPQELVIETILVEEDFSAAIQVAEQVLEISRCPEQDYLRTRMLTSDYKTVNSEDWLPTKRKTDAELVTEILERSGRNRSLQKLITVAGEMLTV